MPPTCPPRHGGGATTKRNLEQLDAVDKVTLFDAATTVPARFGCLKQRSDAVHVTGAALVVLTETRSATAIRAVQSTPPYGALRDALPLEQAIAEAPAAIRRPAHGDACAGPADQVSFRAAGRSGGPSQADTPLDHDQVR